ncbi:MAG: type IV-A pilus assembly ATPase PilB [Acidobacteria bacterium]|nr:type IV-A pilus assembly ATPase PilB [Acidobacteriota bacterium]
MAVRIGDLLLKENLITKEQLDKALETQRQTGGKLGSTLVRLGYISEEDITSVLSRQYGYPSINLSLFEIDPAVIKILPPETAMKYQVVPINKTGGTLTIAMSDPTNLFAIEDIKFMLNYNVEPVVASESAIRAALDKYYGTSTELEVKKVLDKVALAEDANVEVMDAEQEEIDLESLTKATEDAPVIQLVNLILTDALKRGASDIHVEPYEKEFRVRYRIDGILYVVMNPPMRMRDSITNRVKILAKMDIAEKRLPQDGRIKMKAKKDGQLKEIDLRVSCLPTLFGEKIVLRLLDKENLRLDMTKLGFEVDSLRRFEDAILKPYGMVLVTGPTGSGKTNTLYSAMQRINTPETNIMTAEDPVEYNMMGINQVQMKDQIGLNFAAALRSFLRQDPNIILVGEIRDFETAEIAVKAALTGHLVLSTLHTNDAPSTISRLMNMGIEPFLVATSVLVIAAQRLIRRLCTRCKEEVYTPPQALIDIGFSPEEARLVRTYRPKGCSDCNNTGYRGRVALYEVMSVSDDIRELILVGASAMEIRKKSIEEGMITLRGSGLSKIRDGVTSIEEVLRETVR